MPYRLKDRAYALKRDTIALYLAMRDPRTPWYAKIIGAAVVAYALSPFDLIPDFIPIVGYLDDLILVPAGIAVVRRLVPPDVMADCREEASLRAQRPTSRFGAAAVVAVWLGVAVWALLFVRNLLSS
jgi:uncharacterized membrane protein YkvA (DUF1232 family)